MRTRSSFCALALATLAIEAVAVGAATVFSWHFLSCDWKAIPVPDDSTCVSSTWFPVFTSWVAFEVFVGVLAVAFIAVVKAMNRSLDDTHLLLRALLSRRVPLSKRLEHAASHAGLAGRVTEVAVSQSVALTYGLLGPNVLISTGFIHRLTDLELQAVLAHEAEHVRRRDPLWLVIMRSVAAVTVLFPALRLGANSDELEMELRADRRACEEVGTVAFARALSKMLDDPRSGPAIGTSAGSGTGGPR